MASSSSNNHSYTVFLSFRGTDTRYNFTSYLHEALEDLKDDKVKAFIDNIDIERGEEIESYLEKIIEGVKLSIIIFSKEYASSTFCLDEMVKIMECKKTKGQTVFPVFYKVDPSKEMYDEAFARHEQRMVERWRSSFQEALQLAGYPIYDNSNEAKVIKKITRDVSKKLNCQSKGEELVSTPMVCLNSVTINVEKIEKIWKCLMNDETSIIGVYGLGGVGKTTIITHIYNRLIRDTNSYDHIYRVTVSKAFSIYKLQGDIAKAINLNFKEEEDESERATTLWKELNRKKKFILILDDMWKYFEVEEVGIPVSVDVGKLLLTTRMRGVCKTMKCGQIVKVEPLPEQEGCDLFIKESEHQIDTNPELRNIVESVAKQCAGLPLAIVTVARSTRKFVDTFEWRNLLDELKKPSEGQNREMEEKVFTALKVSYDRLKNDKYRQCLLYCSLYPEDYIISRNALIVYWIGEGLIEERDSRQEEFDKGNSIVNELIDASLLERHREDHVKMHDVIRDMALTITREIYMVNAGSQLKYVPEKWPGTLERVSLMENKELKVCCSNLTPNCPKLNTLLMQANGSLIELPNSFFVNMQSLTVLDMGDLRGLLKLPDSIAKLENLRVLILGGCLYLEYIPSFAGLIKLLHLDVSLTSLMGIPDGLENLVNLKVLNLAYNEMLKGLITSAVVEKLSHLQSLRLEESYVEVEPNALIRLDNLETLKVIFYDIHGLKSYLNSVHWRSVEECHIFMQSRKDTNFYYTHPVPYKKVMSFLGFREENENILIPDDIHFLRFLNCDSSINGILRNGTFGNLQELILVECAGVPYLIKGALFLDNVKRLDLRACLDMQEIIATEGESSVESTHNYPIIELPKLETLILNSLYELKSIYKGFMMCPSLETISISGCVMLERLPFCMQDEENLRMMLPSLKQIEGDSWWERLQFHHPDAKPVLQPLFVET